jgi:hypothetical protein
VPLQPLPTLATRFKDKGDIITLLEDGTVSLQSIFPKYPTSPDLSVLHLFVKRPTRACESFAAESLYPYTTPPVKRHRSEGIDSEKDKIRRVEKKWTVNGAINEENISNYYYVDPKGQQVTTRCLTAVRDKEFLLLAGPRASGKTTRLLRLRTLLQESGLICLL